MSTPDVSPLQPQFKVDPAELEQAFSLFTEASRQLVESYQELEFKVGSLTQELAVANGALRQQFEEKAALSRRLETLLAALPGGVVELDAESNVAAMNPAASQIIEASPIGQAWHAAMEHMLGATQVSGEWSYVAPSGAQKRLGIVENTLPGGERILLIHDVSESWRLRAELEQHKRLAAMGEMAAALAHQLRTPLATALLYTANLAKPAIGEAERLKFGEKSLARLRHLETLIKNMLQFVRGQQAEVESVNLADTAEDALQTVQPHAVGRSWRIDWPDEPAFVSANRKELTSALINLLENAVQATGPGDQISVVLRPVDKVWQLRIVDTGAGMTDAVKERLFEPFFTTRKEGTGLGLAIVRNLVRAYGGDITVESAPGEGATFTIQLPGTR